MFVYPEIEYVIKISSKSLLNVLVGIGEFKDSYQM